MAFWRSKIASLASFIGLRKRKGGDVKRNIVTGENSGPAKQCVSMKH